MHGNVLNKLWNNRTRPIIAHVLLNGNRASKIRSSRAAESGESPITIRTITIRPHVGVAMVRIETSTAGLLHPRNVSPLRCHLELATMQFWFIQLNSFLNSFNFNKFHVSKTFWLPKLVSQDCNSVDSSTRIEVLLHFFWSARIVNLQLWLHQRWTTKQLTK